MHWITYISDLITFDKRSSVVVIIVLSAKIMCTYVHCIWQVILKANSHVFPITNMTRNPVTLACASFLYYASYASTLSNIIWKECPVEEVSVVDSIFFELTIKRVDRVITARESLESTSIAIDYHRDIN